MIISYLSEDERGPSVAKQRAIIEESGINPDREFSGDDLEMLGIMIREGDEMVIAHHRAFIGPKLARMVLEMMSRAGAKITVVDDRTYDPKNIEDYHAFLALSAKRWKKFGRTGKGKVPQGRPVKYKVPAGQTLDNLKAMWWRPKTQEDPDGFSASVVMDFASEMLGYEVERHHVKHWISDLRQRPDDGLAKIERKK